MPNPFDVPKAEIEAMIAQGTTVSKLLARNPIKVPFPIKLRLRSFRRLGELTCRKWVIKESENPCILTQMHNGDEPHSVTVQLTEEEINELAESLSASISRSISDATTAEASLGLSLPGGTSLGGKIANTLTRSSSFGAISTASIARKIRRQLQVSEPLRILHVSMRCRFLAVPYGLEAITTVRGNLNFTRSFVQSLSNPRVIELSDNVGVDLGDLKIEASIDPGLDIENQTIGRTPCASCDCEEDWGPIDDGKRVFIPNDAKDAPTDPSFEKARKKGRRRSTGRG